MQSPNVAASRAKSGSPAFPVILVCPSPALNHFSTTPNAVFVQTNTRAFWPYPANLPSQEYAPIINAFRNVRGKPMSPRFKTYSSKFKNFCHQSVLIARILLSIVVGGLGYVLAETGQVCVDCAEWLLGEEA